jgi:hypothetical protein
MCVMLIVNENLVYFYLLLFLSKLYTFIFDKYIAEINAQLPKSLTFKNNKNQIDIQMTIIFIKEIYCETYRNNPAYTCAITFKSMLLSRFFSAIDR